jgi:hypothetical protein
MPNQLTRGQPVENLWKNSRFFPQARAADCQEKAYVIGRSTIFGGKKNSAKMPGVFHKN